ncbi:MAG TPA: GNAT family N-acetyltransferase [Clostridiales bacterium]|nr:MAG: putative ribosomal N-acetyltransferase YdaF [Firmicutes bacterium ADurb.Bin262]HQH63546.1 GNAT family N-acetyltransferase [Clostridiales bacterium]HQK74515.1 GNAT family N-acetyltransferase [Clostridiales bacterium]
MLHHNGTKRLRTQRLVLRRFRAGDAGAMFDNWASDPKVTQYLTWDAHVSPEQSRAVLASWIGMYEHRDYYHWAIEYKGQAIGSIGVVELSDKDERAVAGYCLGYDYWGKGLMTEALSAVVAYMFETVGLNRLYAYHDIENPASGRVMIKCGMQPEGTFREHLRRKDGTFADVRVYAILRSDYLSAL